MASEVKLAALERNSEGFERGIEVINDKDAPIIGRILMTGVYHGYVRQGIIETMSPTRAEVFIKANILRPLRTTDIKDDDRCRTLVQTALRNFGYFNGLV